MEEKTNEIVAFQQDGDMIVNDLENANCSMFCSFEAKTPEEKVSLYRAINGSNKTLKSVMNISLDVRDVIVMPVQMLGDDGTASIVPRTTIITKDGTCYSASSWGIYNSVKKLHNVFQTLHFDDKFEVVVREIPTKNGYTMTLDLV